MRTLIITGLLFTFFQGGLAQVSVKDSSVNIPMIAASYAYQFPGADMATRFGSNSSIGVSFLFKSKSQWLLGFESHFIFGDNVKASHILDKISTKPDSDGETYVIDGNGRFAEIAMFERGFSFMVQAGYQLPVVGNNDNSGLVAIGGIGLLQHKIRIQNLNNTAPQLSGDLKKGYDRLSNGLALSQFLGYMNFSNNNMVNYYFGLELLAGFTRSRRSVDFDMGRQDLTKRMDLLYGIKVGWILPFHKRPADKVYFY